MTTLGPTAWLVGATLVVALGASRDASAQGPAVVATINRKLVGAAELDSRAAFDRASRAEILVFTHELVLAGAAGKGDGPQGGTPGGNAEAARWTQKMESVLVENFRRARTSCAGPDDPGCAGGGAATFAALAELARAFVDHPPQKLAAWLTAARDFHRAYAAEQLRLASLFGKTTSEVLTFNENERNGTELGDLHFVLTFDDGPSRAKGHTDATLKTLRNLGVNGIFFALGKMLEARSEAEGKATQGNHAQGNAAQGNAAQGNAARENAAQGNAALGSLYAGQCLGSHGFSHQSHAKMADWRASIESTAALVRRATGRAATDPVLFRPPYGQRTKEIAAWAATAHSPIVLWNIDSQDWNAKMPAAALPDRIITLMALWRRGTLLFHDIHGKAAMALPTIVKTARASGLVFIDCHDY